MTFKEYEEKAITTKCYADEVAIPYVTLGLCGEMGEFYEKMAAEDISLTLKEVGDVLWYAAAIRIELNLKELKWPIPQEMVDEDPITLITSMGAVAEQIKKYLRDDWKVGQKIEVPENRKEIIFDSLEKILQCLANICQKAFQVTLESIAVDNIKKLADRANRGVIKGSGDER